MSEELQQPALPASWRKPTLITGGVMIAFSLYLLMFLVPDVIKNASGPQDMTLERATAVATDESTYAKIEDGVWHCDTIKYLRRPSSSNRLVIITASTEIFLTDESKPEQIVLLVSMSGEVTCSEFQEIAPEGYLTQMSRSKKQELTNEVRLARFFDATDFMELCGYCGPDNSLIGLGFGVALALGGIVTIILGLRMPKPE
jgi:hypothetical protein